MHRTECFLKGVLPADLGKLPGRVGHLNPYLKSLRHELTSREISPLEGFLPLVCNDMSIDGVTLGAQNED